MYLWGNRRWVSLWHVHISHGIGKIEITSIDRWMTDVSQTSKSQLLHCMSSWWKQYTKQIKCNANIDKKDCKVSSQSGDNRPQPLSKTFRSGWSPVLKTFIEENPVLVWLPRDEGSTLDLSIVALTLFRRWEGGGLLEPPSLKSWVSTFKLWSPNLTTFSKK